MSGSVFGSACRICSSGWQLRRWICEAVRPIDLPRSGPCYWTEQAYAGRQLYESVERRVNWTPGRSAARNSVRMPTIAHAVHGLDRVEGGVHGQELRTNPFHLRRDRTVIENGVGRGHELLAVLHVPRVQGERVDDPELGQRERHGCP